MSKPRNKPSKQGRKTILFCCNRLAPTLELAHVMRALAKEGGHPLALLESHSLLTRLPESALSDIPVEFLSDLLTRYGPLSFSKIIGQIGRGFRLLRIHFLADALATLSGILVGRVSLDRLIEKYDIRAVVVADDRSLGWEFGAVLAARKKGIGSAAIPFALSDPDADWISRSGRPIYDLNKGGGLERWVKRLVRRQYPENIRTKDGRMLMFLTPGQASALLVCNEPMKKPWAYGGGITDVVAVYGEADRTKQLALGVSGKKLVVSGQCSMDQLFASRNKSFDIRKRIFQALGLQCDSKVIVCAVPQYLEHGMLEAPEHWTLTEQMLGSLASSGANVVLSLHPRSRREDYVCLAEKFGALILSNPLIEIIPVADLFVATHSSTVRWAVLMRIPAIVLDDFGVGESIMQLDGVKYLRVRDQLESLCREILFDESVRESIHDKLDKQAMSLDPFDGKNAERSIKLLTELISASASVVSVRKNSERNLHDLN